MSAGVGTVLLVVLAASSAQEAPSGKSVSDTWSKVFGPPSSPAWAVGALAGLHLWKAPHGDYHPEGTYGLVGRRHLGSWTGLWSSAQYSRHGARTASLDVNQQRIQATAGGGLLHWTGRFRLHAGAELGVLYETSELRDEVSQHRGSRWLPLAVISGGAGVSVLGVASAFMQIDVAYAKRLDPRLLFGAEWLLGCEDCE